MSRLGHTTHKYYKETRGIKVSGASLLSPGLFSRGKAINGNRGKRQWVESSYRWL